MQLSFDFHTHSSPSFIGLLQTAWMSLFSGKVYWPYIMHAENKFIHVNVDMTRARDLLSGCITKSDQTTLSSFLYIHCRYKHYITISKCRTNQNVASDYLKP